MFVSLFQIRLQHIFDPFHECADSARQIAPMCYDEGHGERPATKIGYDLHKRSTTHRLGWTAKPTWRPSSMSRSCASRPTADRHNLRMLISRAGRNCSSRYSRCGVSTSSIHFMNARTRRDRLLRCATTRDTASDRRRKSGMISTSAPLSKYRPIPKSGA